MKELERALALRKEGELDQSKEQLVKLAASNPGNGYVQYQCAWSLDILGHETQAVPYYEKAVALGLCDEDAQGAFLGLGSTYRTIGEYEKSREILEKGMKLFPSNRVLQVFHAMTLYNLKEHNLAMEALLMILAETTENGDIKAYSKAIQYYSGKLDTVWG